MNRKLVFTLIFCAFAPAMFAQFVTEDYKSKTNAEIVQQLKEAIAQIKSIERISKIFEDDDKVFYSKDELEPVFKLDTLAPLTVFEEFSNANFSIVQTWNEEGSELHIDDEDFNGSLSGRVRRTR